MKILIPTYRQPPAIQPMIDALKPTLPKCDNDIIASCLPESAAINRNFCLSHVKVGEVAVMLDDDIEGFYPGWIDDLTKPLADESVVMVSARLMNPDGTVGPTCSRCYDLGPEEIEIHSNGVCVLPTAAIAFRHRGHCFDEQFIGSGFEDGDWCLQYLQDDPRARFIQSNKCRLTHLNLMRNQKGKIWRKNEHYFFSKWKPSYVNVMS